jgi:hypothetical protein
MDLLDVGITGSARIVHVPWIDVSGPTHQAG